MTRKPINIARAKEELQRIDKELNDKHLLIGGLAVNQYYLGRQSVDIDLICSHETAIELIRKLYPTNKWNVEDKNNDEYRPSFLITHKHDDSICPIKFGPKILEREEYNLLNWNFLYEETNFFWYKNFTCNNVVIPCVEGLAYTKLISACNRINSVKSEKDFEDFLNFLNQDEFRINKLVYFLEKNKAVDELTKIAYKLVEKHEGRWEDSSLNYMSSLFKGNVSNLNRSGFDVKGLYLANRDALGLSYESLEFIEDVHLDGSSDLEQRYTVYCSSGRIRTREHNYSVSGDTELVNPKVKFSYEANQGTVARHQLRGVNNSSLKNVIHIRPALKKGERLTYSFRMEREHGCYMMTQESMQKSLSEKQQPALWPYESLGITIKHPTERLKLVVIFPEGYEPEGEDNYGVYYGQTMEDTADVEKSRLMKSGSFSYTHDEVGKVILSLVVEYPIMGLTYAIRWVPLEEDYYNKLCENVS